MIRRSRRRPTSLLASILVLGAMLITAVPARAAAPVRTDGADKTVLFIHGYAGPTGEGYNCRGYWDAAMDAMKSWGWTGSFETVRLYRGDTDCTLNVSDGDKKVGIEELGKRLAWTVHNEFSRRGQSVDVIAHSMGGLVVRAALTGVQRRLSGWPPYLYIEDVATLGTPHAGTVPAFGCGDRQCVDMRPGSEFLGWAAENPQSAQGTDWTLIASGSDDVIRPRESALIMEAGHWVLFASPPNPPLIDHDALRNTTGGDPWLIQYRNYYEGRVIRSGQGVSPIRTAKNAIYWWWKW
ncbi:esterase/lipase family protein [Actinosynnema sp. CS-041913]|uniref:esterase/lipase family protein n=1 Tax=Actinosynnema sp. CS-041913 TaxID=3239917 RepID=UPI003D90E25B